MAMLSCINHIEPNHVCSAGGSVREKASAPCFAGLVQKGRALSSDVPLTILGGLNKRRSKRGDLWAKKRSIREQRKRGRRHHRVKCVVMQNPGVGPDPVPVQKVKEVPQLCKKRHAHRVIKVRCLPLMPSPSGEEEG